MIRQFPVPHEPFDGSVEESPLVKLWYGLLADSLKRGCERLHVLPSDTPDKFVVRAYAQGAWQDVMPIPAKMYAAFLQRLKVMASFSLAKRMAHEQGRFRLELRGSVYEIGVEVRVRPDGSQDAMIDLPSQPVQAGD